LTSYLAEASEGKAHHHDQLPQADVNGLKIFYREVGRVDWLKLLFFLHGFPSAGHMFRDLVPRLASRFHLVAPNLCGKLTTPATCL
jgi:hypothetical protein